MAKKIAIVIEVGGLEFWRTGDRILFTNVIDRKDVIAALEEAKKQIQGLRPA